MQTLTKRNFNRAILSKTVDFKARSATRKKEKYCSVRQGQIHQKEGTVRSFYTSNNISSIHVKQTVIELYEEGGKRPVKTSDFNILAVTNRRLID